MGNKKNPYTKIKVGRKKKPNNKVSVSSSDKIPKSLKVEQTINGTHLTWRFSSADRTHDEWGWQNLNGNNLERVMECLHAFETMPWSEIIRQGSHEIPIENLPRPALNRLIDLEKDDWDQVVSFRIGGKPRAWFLRDRSLMRALWWDPDHTVCPSGPNKKQR